MKALIFDVDGTLAETEDLHRRSFNAAFDARGLPWHWGVELNRSLLAVSGGTERLGAFQDRLPEPERLPATELAAIHAEKRIIYRRYLTAGHLAPRPGVVALMAAAREAGLALAVATAASAESLSATMEGCFGTSAETLFDVVVDGDAVTRKKPDPEGYRLAVSRLGLAAEDVLVFEDSPVGFAAARAAGLATVVTPSDHGPRDADFAGAVAVLPSLAPAHWSAFGFPPPRAKDQK